MRNSRDRDAVMCPNNPYSLPENNDRQDILFVDMHVESRHWNYIPPWGGRASSHGEHSAFMVFWQRNFR